MKKAYKLLLILSCLYLPCSSQSFDFEVSEKKGKTLIELKFSKSKEKIYFTKWNVFKEKSPFFSYVLEPKMLGDTAVIGYAKSYYELPKLITRSSCRKSTESIKSTSQSTLSIISKKKDFKKIKPRLRVRLAFPQQENISFIEIAYFKKIKGGFEINTFVINLKNPRRNNIKLSNQQQN